MSSKPLRFSVLPWRARAYGDEYLIETSDGELVATCNRIEDALLIVALANEYNARLCDDEDFKIKPEPAWRRVLIDLRDILAVIWPVVLLLAILTTVSFIGGALWHMSR